MTPYGKLFSKIIGSPLFFFFKIEESLSYVIWLLTAVAAAIFGLKMINFEFVCMGQQDHINCSIICFY